MHYYKIDGELYQMLETGRLETKSADFRDFEVESEKGVVPKRMKGKKRPVSIFEN